MYNKLILARVGLKVEGFTREKEGVLNTNTT